jgi:peroxiredoxin
MTRIALIAAVAALVAAAAGADTSTGDPKAAATLDQKAPDFSLTGIDGKTYRLSDFKGKYVVLEWNNLDCPFVKKHYGSGAMQALQKQYVEKGVIWLTICSSAAGKQGYYEPDQLKTMTAERKLSSTAYLRDADGAVGHAYGARTTPHMFVINPEGVLIYAGAIDDKPSTDPDDIKGAMNYVRASLDEAMTGESIAVKSTASYGCSVKYAN